MYIRPVSSIPAVPARRRASTFQTAAEDAAGFGDRPAHSASQVATHIAAATLNKGNYRSAQAEIAAQLWASRNGISQTAMERQSRRGLYTDSDARAGSVSVSLSA